MPTENPSSGTSWTLQKVSPSSTDHSGSAVRTLLWVLQPEIVCQLFPRCSSFWCSWRSHSTYHLAPWSVEKGRQEERAVHGHLGFHSAVVSSANSSFARNWRCMRKQRQTTGRARTYSIREIMGICISHLLPFFHLLCFSGESHCQQKRGSRQFFDVRIVATR